MRAAADSGKCEMAVFPIPSFLALYRQCCARDAACHDLRAAREFSHVVCPDSIDLSSRQRTSYYTAAGEVLILLAFGLVIACLLLLFLCSPLSSKKLFTKAATRDTSLTTAFDAFYCQSSAAVICSSKERLKSLAHMFGGGEAYMGPASRVEHIGYRRAGGFENAFCDWWRYRDVGVATGAAAGEHVGLSSPQLVESCWRYQTHESDDPTRRSSDHGSGDVNSATTNVQL